MGFNRAICKEIEQKMITDAIYRKVLDAVESEIPLPDGWLSDSKTEDATDSRYILCSCLHNHGLSSVQIQRLTGLKKSTVNKMIAGITDRLDRREITRLWWLQISHILEVEFEE